MTTTVEILDLSAPHTFIQPVKRINEPHDVPSFLASHAYTQIVAFLFQLNAAMFPTITNDKHIQTWTEAPTDSAPVNQLRELLAKLDDMIDEAPPDPGPRRFGNISFRKWYELAEARLPELLAKHLPTNVLSSGGDAAQEEGRTTARDELSTYLLGSFGSPQRLDYGTGHELSFLAFLCGIWKVGGFRNVDDGVEERAIVLGLLEPYLGLVRRLIKTYTLEPAGSRGVWGVDDNAFLPYIFGSAQLCPPLSSVHDPLPSDGSLHDAVDPADIIKPGVIERERHSNMYFGAVGFIYDVKRGPFWEHSPILYDISGIKTGWAKINKGMLKMYNAEVLSKFPVVQHFPFGSLFMWDRDHNAPPAEHEHHLPAPSSLPLMSPAPASSVAAEPILETTLPAARLPEAVRKATWASSSSRVSHPQALENSSTVTESHNAASVDNSFQAATKAS